MQSKLSEEKRVLFQEMIWRLMGNLQDSHWQDMLDPTTPLGRWIRERYVRLATQTSDEPVSLLDQAARVDLFFQNVHPLDR